MGSEMCIRDSFRGHGRSAKPEPPYGWEDFGEDLVALVSHLELQDAIGVGHSMGGHSVIYTALHANRNVFAKMLLVDPVIKVDSSSAPPLAAVEAWFFLRLLCCAVAMR